MPESKNYFRRVKHSLEFIKSFSPAPSPAGDPPLLTAMMDKTGLGLLDLARPGHSVKVGGPVTYTPAPPQVSDLPGNTSPFIYTCRPDHHSSCTPVFPTPDSRHTCINTPSSSHTPGQVSDHLLHSWEAHPLQPTISN